MNRQPVRPATAATGRNPPVRPPVGIPSAYRIRAATSEWTVRREARLALLAMGGEAFLDVRAGEAEKLQGQRGVEDRPGGAQPIVERVFGPADPLGTALADPAPDFEALGLALPPVPR